MNFIEYECVCFFFEEAITEHILTSAAWDCSFVSDIDGYIGQIQMVPGKEMNENTWMSLDVLKMEFIG